MDTRKSSKRPFLPLLAALLALGLAGAWFTLPGHTASEETQAITTPAPAGMQVATFAAGCFWSMQAIFQELNGVEKVVPGYAGGTSPHPSYDEVENGGTGYAEAVDITFNPKVISYQTLLKVLLTARDPTTLNQQGPDSGTNYRSVIFYHNAAQKQEAEAAIRQVNAEHTWPNPIVTTMQPAPTFWRAENYHMNYYKLHPDQPYCAFVIAPEIAKFRAMYPSLLKK
jgi:peptide-methionine (S)-S-oxide reductase